MSLISNTIKKLNIKRRKALIEFLIREDFKNMGFEEVKIKLSEDNRMSISDGKGIIISFDLDYASDFREDAYKWCYVDFFIDKHVGDIDDDLKRRFTRYINAGSRKMYWRHREMVRIIDMDIAVEYILKIKNELETLLKKYDII